MLFGLQELLLNVLFLIIFLLFIPVILELNFSKLSQQNKTVIFNLSTVLAIICCLLNPIKIVDGYIFDLRLAALTFGGLYGGIRSIVILGVVTITSRALLGGLGAFATVIVVTILALLLIFTTKKFNHSSGKKKVLLATLVSSFASVLAISNSTLFFGQSIQPAFIFIYILITITITALLIYLYEVFQGSILLNKQLIKIEKMEVVSHLASSVSHEVRNPLTVTRGFLQLMLHSDLSASKREEYLKISIDEIDRANDIIKDYLTFAKPTPENVTVLNIKEELQRILHVITPLANMNGVEVETKFSEFYAKGNQQYFQQCLLNIVKNCIEAMPNAGKLTLELKSEKKNLIIVISDNGEGMSKEQLARLGEPYFTTKGKDGTGLGMMVSMKIIDSMGGKLNVNSELNVGTNFYITLPSVK